MADSVCGIIITFHPSEEMIGHISKVIAQTSGLVVVDNGSSAEAVSLLRRASQELGFHLIENSENLGIAEALNQGVRWAKSGGYQWTILFDQDSRITDSFVRLMMGSWESHPKKDILASLHPRYVDTETGYEEIHENAEKDGLLFSMTSGSLLPISIYDKIGLFASEYFIDYVDFEYCLRARAAGYMIGESRQAILHHAPGDPSVQSLFGIKSFRTSNHSALRRYYLIRNRIVTARRYFKSFPLWTINDLLYTFKEAFVIVLAENNKCAKLRAMLNGAMDAFAGRMGKLGAS